MKPIKAWAVLGATRTTVADEYFIAVKDRPMAIYRRKPDRRSERANIDEWIRVEIRELPPKARTGRGRCATTRPAQRAV